MRAIDFKHTANFRKEEKKTKQQRLLIPRSGVSSPDVSQMVMRDGHEKVILQKDTSAQNFRPNMQQKKSLPAMVL